MFSIVYKYHLMNALISQTSFLFLIKIRGDYAMWYRKMKHKKSPANGMPAELFDKTVKIAASDFDYF